MPIRNDTATEGLDRGLHGARLIVLVAALLTAQILDGMDVNALAFVGPNVSRDLGLSRSLFGASVGVAFFGSAIGAVLFGAIADRIGRRRALLIVVALFGVGSLTTAFVTSAAELIAVRALTGMALGGLLPISASILLERAPLSVRTTAVAIVTGGSAAGVVLAGAVTALLVPTFGWRSVFILGGLAPLAIIPVLLVTIPPDQLKTREIAPGESRRPAVYEPRRPLLLRDGAWKLTLSLWVAMLLGAMPVFGIVSWLPSLVASTGALPSHTALVAVMFSIGGAVGGIVAGRLMDRMGFSMALPLAICAAVAAAALGWTIESASIVPLAAVAGFFIIGFLTMLTSVVGQFYSADARGLATGSGLAATRIGAALSPWIAGRLLDGGADIKFLFVSWAGAAIVSGLVFVSALRLRHDPKNRDLLS